MTSRRLLFLSLIALLAIGWTRPPQEADGAVVGQVTNGTPGGDVPANLEVKLYVFSEAGDVSTGTTLIASDGSFRFDGLATDAGKTFVASAVYQDVAYFSEEIAFESGQTELALPIAIYETTEDPSAIFITQAHLFLTVAGDLLQVGEYYLVSNSGDRTYVGAPDPETGLRTTLSVLLPAGASSLSLDGGVLGERFVQQAEGFADTSPIPPGVASADVSFSYALSYSQGQPVERVFTTPVDSVVLVPMTDGWTLAGDGLRLVEAQGAEWPPLSYAAGPLATGEPLTFSLVAGSQTEPAAARTRSATQEAAIGLAALAAALAAAYFIWRPAAPGPAPDRARPLVEAIAALDADVERVSEKTYRQKRNGLKQQLRALLKDEFGDRDS